MFTPRSFKLKRHSRRVVLFKRGLPVFAFMLASVMLLWPSVFAEQKEQFSVAVKSNQKNLAPHVDIESVRFYTQDKKKQPLTVTAPRVLETDSEKQIVTLYKPEAVYDMASGVRMTSNTSQGLIYQQEEYMLFEDEVVTTTDTGYRAVSTQVVCDNKAGALRSRAPVTITGPAGKLKAEGFEIYNRGDNIDFLNKTDSTIFSEKGDIRVRSSAGLFIVQSRQEITAVGDVIVNHEDRTITADKMRLVYNTKEQDPNNRIRSIEAFDHVIVQDPTYKMTGDKGVYDPVKGIMTMTGNVVLIQGGSRVTGDKATLNLTTGESDLVPQATTSGGRVRGRLNPADFKGDKK